MKIFDDLLFSATSPLFLDICDTLNIRSDIISKLRDERDRENARRLVRELLDNLDVDKFYNKLEKEDCYSILVKMKQRFEVQIKGQDELLRILLIAIVMNENVLLEGLPGVGKTVIVKWISRVTGLPFSRVQFIPDMLPSDLIGKDRINPVLLQNNDEKAIEWVNGPIFSSLVLADEINRAPSKVQAALLEAMGENEITPFGKDTMATYSNIHTAVLEIGEKSNHEGLFGLTRLPIGRRGLAQFTVFATMNPIEQEGTYPLSEAQMDRFCFKVVVPYPDRDSYEGISKVMFKKEKQIDAVKGNLPIETYKKDFKDKDQKFMIPIIAPIYFLLRCRSYIIPVIMNEQLKEGKKEKQYMEEGETLYDIFHNEGQGNSESYRNIDKLYDIVLMTNAKTASVGISGSARSRYDIEQIEMRRFIEKKKNGNNGRYKKLKRALDLPHCQYVLAGASPRGFESLERAALCEAFLDGSNSVEPRHIRAVINSVLQHRIHMDVHSRLQEVTPLDVIHSICDVILEEES